MQLFYHTSCVYCLINNAFFDTWDLDSQHCIVVVKTSMMFLFDFKLLLDLGHLDGSVFVILPFATLNTRAGKLAGSDTCYFLCR